MTRLTAAAGMHISAIAWDYVLFIGFLAFAIGFMLLDMFGETVRKVANAALDSAGTFIESMFGIQ